jgi:flagellar M-ring protein FliF
MEADALRSRLKGIRSSVSNGQLAILGVLTVIALVAVMWFVSWVSAPSYRVLAAGQTPEETNTIVEQLDADGIAYKLSNGGTTIMVKEADLSKAKLGVSSVSGAATVAGLELFDKQGFTTSEFQQRVDYQRALQGELTRAILKIDGVRSATVQLAIPAERLFKKDEQAVRASVLVGTSSALPANAVTSIVELVSAAVPGLDASNVTVTDTRGRVLASGNVAAGQEDTRTERTADYELALASKAESMLAQVYGPGRVTVRVTADLDFDAKSTERTTYEADNAIPVRQSQSSETYTGAGTPPNGVVGVEGQVTGNTNGGENTYTREDVATESVVASSVERTTTAPGSVRTLSAAAVVDSAIDPQPDPENIRALISAASGAKDDRDTIVVQSMQFDEAAEEGLDGAAGAGSTAPSPLMNYVRTGVGAVVLLFVLLFLRKSLKTTTEPVDMTQAAIAAARDSSGRRDPSVYSLDGASPMNIPSELKLLDAEPEALANALRSWVADRREVVR